MILVGDTAKQIFKVDEPIYIPTRNVCDFFSCLKSLPKLGLYIVAILVDV